MLSGNEANPKNNSINEMMTTVQVMTKLITDRDDTRPTVR